MHAFPACFPSIPELFQGPALFSQSSQSIPLVFPNYFPSILELPARGQAVGAYDVPQVHCQGQGGAVDAHCFQVARKNEAWV